MALAVLSLMAVSISGAAMTVGQTIALEAAASIPTGAAMTPLAYGLAGTAGVGGLAIGSAFTPRFIPGLGNPARNPMIRARQNLGLTTDRVIMGPYRSLSAGAQACRRRAKRTSGDVENQAGILEVARQADRVEGPASKRSRTGATASESSQPASSQVRPAPAAAQTSRPAAAETDAAHGIAQVIAPTLEERAAAASTDEKAAPLLEAHSS